MLGTGDYGRQSIVLVCFSGVLGWISWILWYAVQKHSLSANHASRKVLQSLNVPSNSLFRILQSHLIPMDVISDEWGYSSVLIMANAMLGLIPSSDMVLAIWKPALECYTLLFPNCLNLPIMLLPGYPISNLVALATYVSSRANQCMYCSAHAYTFAVRRGVNPQAIQNSLLLLLGNQQNHSKEERKEMSLLSQREQATIRVAYGLSTVPPCLQK